MTPEQKSLRGRLAAALLHSRYDSRQLTERARRVFRDKFIDEVDPHRRLPEPERMRRAEQAPSRLLPAIGSGFLAGAIRAPREARTAARIWGGNGAEFPRLRRSDRATHGDARAPSVAAHRATLHPGTGGDPRQRLSSTPSGCSVAVAESEGFGGSLASTMLPPAISSAPSAAPPALEIS